MAKSSKGMWEAARARQVTVTPALPEDLSEPQYADLLFGKGCSVRLIQLLLTRAYEIHNFFLVLFRDANPEAYH